MAKKQLTPAEKAARSAAMKKNAADRKEVTAVYGGTKTSSKVVMVARFNKASIDSVVASIQAALKEARDSKGARAVKGSLICYA
jgi:dihydrodipicolinate synthase/N-acetylneuraminate lyase